MTWWPEDDETWDPWYGSPDSWGLADYLYVGRRVVEAAPTIAQEAVVDTVELVTDTAGQAAETVVEGAATVVQRTASSWLPIAAIVGLGFYVFRR